VKDPMQPDDDHRSALHHLKHGTATIHDQDLAVRWLQRLYDYYDMELKELEAVPIYAKAKASGLVPHAVMRNIAIWIENLLAGKFNNTETLMRARISKTEDVANDRQVAGSHYKASHQHWDFVLGAKISYLAAQAMRYVTRWRKKDGPEALDKTDHYIEKMIAVHAKHMPYIALDDYAEANALNNQERMIIGLLMSYESSKDPLLLHAARAMLAVLRQSVPKTDPN
jgi:hypothetical protein